MPERIERDVVAILSFTATDADADEVLEHAPSMAYLHGHDNLPSAFEAKLEGLSAGDDFDETVPDAFGAATGASQSVRKGDLPKHVRDSLRVGGNFVAEGSDGTRHVLWVTAMKGGRVTVTADHPYAGKNIRFAGTVVQLRSPTASELEHHHAHGPGGHHHH
jgi:FKBP-type peptidyl-prolyl cis-trans isomerase SlyD